MSLPLSPIGRRYGRLPSEFDPRDHSIRGTSLERVVSFPPSADLRQYCGPVKDQGNLGSCTAHAYSSLLELLYRKFKNQQPIFSPLFLYYQERLLEGDVNDDSGAQSRTGCRVLAHTGVCLEATDPYNISTFTSPPTTAQLVQALTYKGGAYHRLNSLLDIKACLSEGFPHAVGFDVYDSFESRETAATGLMPVPNKETESLLGGHETLVVGFDDSIVCPRAKNPGALIVQNSWGVGWGKAGFFFMPYDFVTDPTSTSDYFFYHLGKPWKPAVAA